MVEAAVPVKSRPQQETPLASEIVRRLDRVLPVIEAIRSETDVQMSVDTSKPGVMREAVAAGASMINDVTALRVDGALETAAELNVAVCLMHMRGQPRSMQNAPTYNDVVAEVAFQAPADTLAVPEGEGSHVPSMSNTSHVDHLAGIITIIDTQKKQNSALVLYPGSRP